MVAHHLTPACQPNIAGPPIQHIHTSNPNPLPSPFFRLLASSVPRRSARGPWGGTTVAVGRNWEAAAAVGGGDSEVGTRRCHGVHPRSRETGKRRRHRVGSGFERGRVASRRASAAVVGAARQTPLTWGATMRPLVVILFLLFFVICVYLGMRFGSL
jgi:hypothetical protein